MADNARRSFASRLAPLNPHQRKMLDRAGRIQFTSRIVYTGLRGCFLDSNPDVATDDPEKVVTSEMMTKRVSTSVRRNKHDVHGLAHDLMTIDLSANWGANVRPAFEAFVENRHLFAPEDMSSSLGIHEYMTAFGIEVDDLMAPQRKKHVLVLRKFSSFLALWTVAESCRGYSSRLHLRDFMKRTVFVVDGHEMQFKVHTNDVVVSRLGAFEFKLLTCDGTTRLIDHREYAILDPLGTYHLLEVLKRKVHIWYNRTADRVEWTAAPDTHTPKEVEVLQRMPWLTEPGTTVSDHDDEETRIVM